LRSGQKVDISAIVEKDGRRQPVSLTMGRSEALAPLKASSLRENIGQVLTEAILSGRFPPGARLNESALGRQLQVSRAPIREALHQLQEQGLVINRPRRGMFVVNLTPAEIDKINCLRLILEAEALLLCRGSLTAQGERKLLQQLEKIERRGPTPGIEATRLDLAFHRTIWGMSGNEYLEKTLTSLTAPLFAYAIVRKPAEEQMRMILDSHRPLLDFIQGRIPADQARWVMHEHISVGWGRQQGYAPRYPPEVAVIG
jgi:DNA-binding GntR family transcriptional regulator